MFNLQILLNASKRLHYTSYCISIQNKGVVKLQKIDASSNVKVIFYNTVYIIKINAKNIIYSIVHD